MSELSIVLADDHHVVRSGLRLLLESKLPARIVGEAATGTEALALVERLHPDMLIVDLMMPGLNGLDVTRRVCQSSKTCVVILSMHSDCAYVREALRAGATAYILKESLSDEFLYGLRQAALGRRYLSPSLAEDAIDAFVQQSQEAHTEGYEALTSREREVLYLAAKGYTSAKIASHLTIGVRTVDWHRANLMRKLGIHSMPELVRYALHHGIISGK